MAARGQRETAQLRTNAEEQITRLMTQLSDLEELREARAPRCNGPRQRLGLRHGAERRRPRLPAQDMDAEEYESTKSETLKQLEEFHASLSRLMARARERAHAACAADEPRRRRRGT